MTDFHVLAHDSAPPTPGATGSDARVRVLLVLSRHQAGITSREIAALASLDYSVCMVALRGPQAAGRAECVGRGLAAVWRLLLKGER
jgi:hypothetical protein